MKSFDELVGMDEGDPALRTINSDLDHYIWAEHWEDSLLWGKRMRFNFSVVQ